MLLLPKANIEPIETKILCVTFSPCSTHLSVGTTQGFIIFSVYPLKQLSSVPLCGGIGIIESLWERRQIFLVGGGPKSAFPKDEVRIWDDVSKSIIRCMKFSDPVISLKVKIDTIAIGIKKNILIYGFEDSKICDTLYTYEKWNGSMALNTGKECTLLAWPHKEKGVIALKLYKNNKTEQEFIIKLGKTEIVCLSLNVEGTLLAVSTEKGTMIKIYNTFKRELLQELRRGSYRCSVHQLLFHKSNRYLLCSSNKKSVHIFLLKKTESENSRELLKIDPKAKNKTSKYIKYNNYMF